LQANIKQKESQEQHNKQPNIDTLDKPSDSLNVMVDAPSIDGHITLGSTKEQVKQVMGPPTSLNDNRWGYDFSSVNFEGDFVVGWSNISDNLKIKLGVKVENTTFTLGTSKEPVIKAMGTPTDISYNRWGYDYSSIIFEGDEVVGWSNISDNIQVYMADQISNSFFSVGSTRHQVLDAMGTPDGISYNRWFYNYSSVQF
jgi:outer membrane protein assembly factor BamE (lipoprotein component of BamABCDE complex)